MKRVSNKTMKGFLRPFTCTLTTEYTALRYRPPARLGRASGIKNGAITPSCIYIGWAAINVLFRLGFGKPSP
jgi:hypothetical protein